MNNPINLVVIGASGFGRETLDVLKAMKESGKHIQILGVVDDAPAEVNLQRLSDRNITYLGTIADWLKSNPRDCQFLIGIGNPDVKHRLARRLKEFGLKAFTAIHPTASIGSQTIIGEGCVICAGVVISTNVNLLDHVHINPNVTIGHDSILQRYVSINPSAVVSGEVDIQERVLVGAAALILQQLTIGAGSLIGAAALVTKNIPSNVTVIGIPGRWHE